MKKASILSLTLFAVAAVEALSLSSAQAAPAGRITGRVVNGSTKKPLANVAVTARSGTADYSARTNARGRFVFRLPAGLYRIAAFKSHYRSEAPVLVLLRAGAALTLPNVRLWPAMTTIDSGSRPISPNSAFLPSRTQDTSDASGSRILQALGNATNQSEQNLILAAPGAMLDSQGNVALRGSLQTELNYAYDGVDVSIPFDDGNGASNYLQNIVGGSGGSLQVRPGAGDATQGDTGSGVVDVIPPRGTYPGSGLAAVTIGSPYYDHQFDLAYGFASPDNRLSDYFSYDGSRSVPQYAPFGIDAAAIGEYAGISYVKHDDLMNNLIYRFGHYSDMSFQVLTRWENNDAWGNYGGLAQAAYYPYNPLAYAPWVGLYPGTATMTPLQEYQSVVGLLPGVPAIDSPVTQAEQVQSQPMSFAKLGYTWNISPTTFLDASYANFYQQTIGTNTTNGSAYPSDVQLGGQRLADELDLTHQFGARHTVTLALHYEDDLPRWNQISPSFSQYSLWAAQVEGLSNEPQISDWYLPPNTSQPVGVGNPCPNAPPAAGGGPGTCYVYTYMLTHGLWDGTLPRIPSQGLDYNHTIFHQWGAGLRDQWTLNSRLHLDYGLRLDGDNLDWGRNPWNNSPQALSNPSDVNPQVLTNAFLRPRVVEPRFAASYELGTNDVLRFAYGRSVEFLFAQIAGTPFGLTGVPAFFAQMPAKDAATGVPGCGSSYNPTQTQGNRGYLGNQWFCANYADSLYWVGDQFLDAPDVGDGGPPIYNNFDLSWEHRLARGALNGAAFNLTAFTRRGYGVLQFQFPVSAPPNPIASQVYSPPLPFTQNGVEKTAGLEFMLTLPNRPSGWSGFLTMNYISAFSNTPPVDSGNAFTDQQPLLDGYLYNGQMYRSAFLPPFQGRLGIAYKSKGGLRVNPIFSFDGGYPVGVGSATVAPFAAPFPYSEQYMWVPATNLAAPVGGPNGPNNAYNASAFVDPADPGSLLAPNIAATRGWNEPALPGGTLSKPHGYLDLDLEWSPSGTPWTVGAYVGNLFDNHYGLWYPNTAYQPVATGVAGPQSGELAASYPSPANELWLSGARDPLPLTLPGQPFQAPYNAGTTFAFYLQRRL